VDDPSKTPKMNVSMPKGRHTPLFQRGPRAVPPTTGEMVASVVQLRTQVVDGHHTRAEADFTVAKSAAGVSAGRRRIRSGGIRSQVLLEHCLVPDRVEIRVCLGLFGRETFLCCD
jgi:hypothetical protein